MIQSLIPNILVENVAESVEYYRSVLGFQLINSVPGDAGLQWAQVQRDKISIMFQSRASLGNEFAALLQMPVGGALTFFIIVEGLDDLYAEIRANADIIKEPYTTFYGMREFAVQDCNRYILVFAERIDS